MPSEFFYNGHLRWSLYWPNPNAWAALLVCVLPLFWVLADIVARKMKTGEASTIWRARLLLLLPELAVWFLLVKTYSRGGIVAAFGAMLFYFFVRRTTLRDGKIGTGRNACATFLKEAGARFAAVIVLMFLFGALGRYSPGFVMADKSVGNRFEMWQGALAMIYDSPFNGWGFDNSGLSYINWYQPLAATERPIGFVNSYLDVAVELGLHTLAAVLMALVFLVLLSLARRDSKIAVASGACLLAWGIANMWSSLWTEPLLWVLPALASIVIVATALWPRLKDAPTTFLCGIGSALIQAFLIVSIIMLAVWNAGKFASSHFDWRVIRKTSSDKITLCKRFPKSPEASPANPRTEIWADGAVFGSFYGRTIRTLAPMFPTESAIIYPPWHVPSREEPKNNPASVLIFSGFHAARIASEPLGEGTVVLLHPTVFPPDGTVTDSKTVLVLPSADSTEYGLPWRRWASVRNVKLVYSPQRGQRILPAENPAFWRQLFTNPSNLP